MSEHICVAYVTSKSIKTGFDIFEVPFQDLTITHLVYHCATVNKKGHLIFPTDFQEFKGVAKIQHIDDKCNLQGTSFNMFSIKAKNRSLKTIFSIMCDITMLNILKNDVHVSLLVDQVVNVIRDMGFDGIMLYIKALHNETDTYNIHCFLHTTVSLLLYIQHFKSWVLFMDTYLTLLLVYQ
jgi:GH18 family chitinase